MLLLWKRRELAKKKSNTQIVMRTNRILCFVAFNTFNSIYIFHFFSTPNFTSASAWPHSFSHHAQAQNSHTAYSRSFVRCLVRSFVHLFHLLHYLLSFTLHVLLENVFISISYQFFWTAVAEEPWSGNAHVYIYFISYISSSSLSFFFFFHSHLNRFQATFRLFYRLQQNMLQFLGSRKRHETCLQATEG